MVVAHHPQRHPALCHQHQQESIHQVKRAYLHSEQLRVFRVQPHHSDPGREP